VSANAVCRHRLRIMFGLLIHGSCLESMTLVLLRQLISWDTYLYIRFGLYDLSPTSVSASSPVLQGIYSPRTRTIRRTDYYDGVALCVMSKIDSYSESNTAWIKFNASEICHHPDPRTGNLKISCLRQALEEHVTNPGALASLVYGTEVLGFSAQAEHRWAPGADQASQAGGYNIKMTWLLRTDRRNCCLSACFCEFMFREWQNAGMSMSGRRARRARRTAPVAGRAEKKESRWG